MAKLGQHFSGNVFREWCIYCGYGVMTWLLPFIASFLCFNQSGKLVLEFRTFKTFMILCASAVYPYYLRKAMQRNLVNGTISLVFAVAVCAAFIVVNYILDFVVLMPLMRQQRPEFTYVEYFKEIGLRYLMGLPIAYHMAVFRNVAAPPTDSSFAPQDRSSGGAQKEGKQC